MLSYTSLQSTIYSSHTIRCFQIKCIVLLHVFQGNVRLMAESVDMSAGCYYMFEIDHVAACNRDFESKGISIGSVVVIM